MQNKSKIETRFESNFKLKKQSSTTIMYDIFLKNETYFFKITDNGFILSSTKKEINNNKKLILENNKYCSEKNEDHTSLKSMINNDLFNLLCNLIEQSNNDDRYPINSFLIFAIIYKFLSDLKIPEYIRMYNLGTRIQIYKENLTNKIGILEDKNNKLKLANFIRNQRIDFKNYNGRVEINTRNHFFSVKSKIDSLMKILKFQHKFTKNSEIIKIFCDSFSLGSHVFNDKNSFEIMSEINQSFEYQKYINNSDNVDEKSNYGKIETHKNINRQKFLKKIEMFEERIKKDSKNYGKNMKKFAKNINKKSEKSKRRNKKRLKKINENVPTDKEKPE